MPTESKAYTLQWKGQAELVCPFFTKGSFQYATMHYACISVHLVVEFQDYKSVVVWLKKTWKFKKKHIPN